MKPIFLILLFSVFFFYNNRSAQTSNQPQSVLWSIQKLGSAKTSYLLGSYHIFGKEWVDSFPKLDSIVNVSDVYLCESTSSIDTGKSHQETNKPNVTHPNAKAIFGKDYDKVNKYFVDKTGEGLSENIDKEANPGGALYFMLFYLSYDLNTGNDLKLSTDRMDENLLSNAFSKRKRCIALDEPSVTNDIFNASYIKSAAKQIANMVDQLNDKTKLGTASPLKPSTKDSLYNKGKWIFNFNNNLGNKTAKVTTRNNLWMTKLPTYLSKDKTFIVVGIGHLDGAGGLIVQLKKQGYKVAPVAL